MMKDKELFIKTYDELKSAAKVADALGMGKVQVYLYAKEIGYNSKQWMNPMAGKKVGNTYGELTVLEPTDKRDTSNGSIIYLCQCSCGNLKEVSSKHLHNKSGGTKSCGCLLKKNSANRCVDLTGQVFDKLTVIERDLNAKEKQTTTGARWICKCSCGNYCSIRTDHLRDGSNTSCGCDKKSSSRGEDRVCEVLTELGYDFKQQYSFADLKNVRPLRFDFAILQDDRLLFLIEYDGLQHYYYDDRGWNTQVEFEARQMNDNKKNLYCEQHNIPLLRIPYWIKSKQEIIAIIQNFVKEKL